MSSVTQRIKEVKQPRGGYIPPKSFSVYDYDDGLVLNENENIHASLVGLSVDYLTRFMMFGNVEDSFKISKLGATTLDLFERTKNNSQKANRLMELVVGLDDQSIISACKLSGFDVVYRAGIKGYKPIEEINPDSDTIENIRIMVNRSIRFFEDYGPVVLDGFTFEGGYTETVSAGDGDFMTENTLWDFKVSVKEITNKHTLQLLMYYIMGIHSKHAEFKNVKFLGVYNPRLNKVYTLEIEKIPQSVIQEVGDEVIGYNPTNNQDQYSDERRGVSDNAEEVLKLKDLAQRYGVSTSKITKSFLPLGLPYYKKGNTYQIKVSELIEWEAKQRYVPYGRNDIIILPTYYVVLDKLNESLVEAKANNDRERVKEIKRTIKKYRIDKSSNAGKVVGYFVAIIIVLIVMYFVFKTLL